MHKAATAGTIETISGTWGSELASLSTAFIASLSSAGIFDAVLPSLVPMPLNTRAAIVIGRAIAEEVGAGAMKPCGEIALSNSSLLPRKVAVVLASTIELWRLGGAQGQALLQGELRSSVASATDAVFVSVLTDGLVAIASTNPMADLAKAAEAITVGNGSRLWAIISPLNAKRLAFRQGTDERPMFPDMTLQGGNITAAVTALVTDEISDSEMLVFDSRSVAASGGVIQVDGSGEAVVQPEEG